MQALEQGDSQHLNDWMNDAVQIHTDSDNKICSRTQAKKIMEQFCDSKGEFDEKLFIDERNRLGAVILMKGNENIRTLILRAVNDCDKGMGNYGAVIDDDALEFLADMAGGDARSALNAVALGILTTPKSEDGSIHLTLDVASECIQKRVIKYDKKGDNHYDIISAFIKSMRGSDPDAAVYYLATMLYAASQAGFLVWIVRYMTLQYNAESLGSVALSLYWLFGTISRVFAPKLKVRPLVLILVGVVLTFMFQVAGVLSGSAVVMCIAGAAIGLVSGHCVPMILSVANAENPGNSSLIACSFLISIYATNSISPLLMGALASLAGVFTAGLCFSHLHHRLGGISHTQEVPK